MTTFSVALFCTHRALLVRSSPHVPREHIGGVKVRTSSTPALNISHQYFLFLISQFSFSTFWKSHLSRKPASTSFASPRSTPCIRLMNSYSPNPSIVCSEGVRSMRLYTAYISRIKETCTDPLCPEYLVMFCMAAGSGSGWMKTDEWDVEADLSGDSSSELSV